MRLITFFWAAVYMLLPVVGGLAGAQDNSIARIHWIGTDRLLSSTNTAYLGQILNQPDSARLKSQTLDKLSSAPWHLFLHSSDTNRAVLLRPLLDDLVRQETYLEIRRTNGEAAQLVLAVHLDASRAALWQSNLAAALNSLTGIRPSPVPGHPESWTLTKHHQPNRIELTRAGGWTLVGIAQDRNGLLDEAVANSRAAGVPFRTQPATNCLDAMIDLPRLSGSLRTNWTLAGDWPRVVFAVAGEGTNLHTRGRVEFAHLPPMHLDAWNIPISLMDGPQFSLTAVRGFEPLLESLPFWKTLKVGPAPNQVFAWALPGEGMNSYAAAPLADASNAVARISDLVMQKWGASFETNDVAKFVRAETFNGLEWQGLPWLAPTLESMSLTNGSFVVGRLFPLLPTDPPPPLYYAKVLSDPDLVYYDLEQTEPRTKQWLYIGQFTRMVSGKPQMPAQCVSLDWLKAIGPSLHRTETRVTSAGSGRFDIDRSSTVGFTGIELHLIGDWLESPTFPIGLHTFSTPDESK